MHRLYGGAGEKQPESGIAFGRRSRNVRLENIFIRRDARAVVRDHDSAHALAFYRDHPAHVKAATFVRSVVDVRLCLDFNE